MVALMLLACTDTPYTTRNSEAHVAGATTGEGTPEEVAAGRTWVEVVSPGEGEAVTNPVTFTVRGEGVETVGLIADGWPLADAWPLEERATLTYSFSETGRRELILVGFDASGCAEAWDSLAITISDEAPPPTIAITSPADGAVTRNPVTFTVAAEGVSAVQLSAEGWPLSEPWDPSVSDQLTYTFSYTEAPRAVLLEGFDASGAVVATDTMTVAFEDEASAADWLDVPYFYQYDNRYEPSATCGVTSAAMLLRWWGVTVTPDDLYLDYGKAQGQSPSGLSSLYSWEGLRSDHGHAGTRAQLKAHLDAGRPVVVHGFWTGAGHIAVLTGYDATGWYANDPAGDWYACYGCDVSGEQVHYPFDGAWDDDMSYDGDIWWSTADSAPF